MPTSCLLNSTLEGKHSEGARKEQSSVGGIEPCLTSISGDIYVGYLEIVIVEDDDDDAGVVYNAMKDQYKVYADGEKVESGSWSDSPFVGIKKIKLLISIILFLVDRKGWDSNSWARSGQLGRRL